MRWMSTFKNLARNALVVALVLTATSAFALEQFNGVEPDAEHEALIANPYASSGSCGVERWSVKTGTDADAGSVNLSSPQSNTIITLRSWAAPNPIPPNNRVAPYETTTWVLNATLVEYKLENDSDYHLVIQDASGNTMIAEIPDPACVGAGSPFTGDIQSARAEFDAQYTATTSFQSANIPVQLTGVGMFDFLHGQTGVAPNGIELHPVLGIVFNPSGGGSPDFALSASPQSVSVAQGAGVGTTIAVTPSNGFTGNVTFSASGLPSGVTAAFNPASSSASSTMTLTADSAAATGSATVTVTGTSGSLSHTASVNLTVIPSGGGGGTQTAVYNSTLKVPECASVGAACDSGTLLVGRGSMSGGAEPNHPNTINNSCADGSSGTFHSDESNDRIVISSTDGGLLTAGKTAQVTATIWAYSAANVIDIYSAADASNPSWTFLSSITSPAAGAQSLSTTFTLPAGGLQAVRAHLRYNGTASACSTGSYDESDDLVFAVSANAPAPDFSIAASPGSVSVTQGASGTSTVTISPQNGFSGSVALSASGLPSGVSAAFNPASTTGNSTLTLSASSVAVTGTVTVTITGVSGALTHTTTLNLTVNAAVTGGTPSANFTFTTSGLSASFTDSSTDTGGTIGSHSWNFGDSATSTATNPSHTYAAAGSYSVTETVTDSINGTSSSKTQSVTVSSGGGGNVLQNGVAVTGLSAATGGQLTYTMVVPAGATGLTFAISGGTGDADLYVKFGSAPTTASYDCRPYITGNNETCNISNVQAGTYYVMLNGYAAFSGVSLVGSYTAAGGGGGGCTPSGMVLCSGSTVTGLSASTGNWSSTYTIVIPSGASTLTVAISGGTGDADLYVRMGSAPTTSSYICRPYLTGNSETCTISSPTVGATYYIRVRAYATYSGVSLNTTIQ
ncbi:MAG: pre-peptidase C-terminal domain-containing protein [Rudaea sp.]